jgi:hypothetical protein
MQLIDTYEALNRAAATTPDLQLRRILALRRDQLGPAKSWEPEKLARFHLVEPGDTLADIEGALGFSPLENFVDGNRYPEPGFVPSWEWVEDHGGWLEVVFILSDDGPAEVLLVPASEATQPIANAARAFSGMA